MTGPTPTTLKLVKQPLLIVDDDEDIRSQMKWALVDQYDVLVAEDRPSAVSALRERQPKVVLLDLGLPPNPADTTEGFAALAEVLSLRPFTKVIIISGQAEKANALRAIGEGAYDFLPKPVEMEELKLILKRAFHVAELEREYHALQQQWSGDGFEGMVGSSPQMQEVFTLIRKVATAEAPVLILGESGTGKEVAAKAIHRRSARRDGPFVPINCSAIPETLMESELFGYEKGAFTGANTQRKGRFESASGGTLFLDEIGELSLPLQVKLLRFLQEQTIERVGGRVPIKVDTRVVAATNMDLKQAMQAGTFREDLYYRLAVVVLRVPPLRERKGDILVLANAFLKRCAAENRTAPSRFSAAAALALEQHAWPGNVRELENRVKRGSIMAEGAEVNAVDLELAVAGAETAPACTLKEAREAVERSMVEAALRRHRNKISPAAAELGISRPTFYELMDKLGMRKEEAKPEV